MHPFAMETAAILVHSLNRFLLCTKMAAVVVAKLLLCCDIICKRIIRTLAGYADAINKMNCCAYTKVYDWLFQSVLVLNLPLMFEEVWQFILLLLFQNCFRIREDSLNAYVR